MRPASPSSQPVRNSLIFILLTVVFALAYAAEEALSEEFLEYIDEYTDVQGELMDPIDLLNLEAKPVGGDEANSKTEEERAP